MTAAEPSSAPEVSDEAEDAGTDGTTYGWESRFGTIVIEVREGRVYVDGTLVERLEGPPAQVGRNAASNCAGEVQERPAA